MTICIHRGTNCIGGCVTELRTGNTRILIDYGAPLPEEDRTPVQIEDFSHIDAVFFTHYHQDHLFFLEQIPAHIPVYLGEEALEIFRRYAARVKLPGADRLRPVRSLTPVQVGELTVLPIPADHSAYDACFYYVTHKDSAVLHTGDFRLHGFRSKGTWKLLKKYAPKVDLLICEGTKAGQSAGLSEYALQQELKTIFAQHKYVFVLCSSTNIDRLACIHNAVPRGRYFLCDAYQKQILQAVASRAVSRWYKFQKALTPGENLKLQERGFVIAVRASDSFTPWMEQFPDSVLVYSMWPGYLDGRAPKLSAFVKPYKDAGSLRILHASGHAPQEDLIRLCKAVSPTVGVIPIHTDAPQCFQNFGVPCLFLKDKECISI